jgi:hypothetical protein
MLRQPSRIAAYDLSFANDVRVRSQPSKSEDVEDSRAQAENVTRRRVTARRAPGFRASRLTGT